MTPRPQTASHPLCRVSEGRPVRRLLLFLLAVFLLQSLTAGEVDGPPLFGPGRTAKLCFLDVWWCLTDHINFQLCSLSFSRHIVVISHSSWSNMFTFSFVFLYTVCNRLHSAELPVTRAAVKGELLLECNWTQPKLTSLFVFHHYYNTYFLVPVVHSSNATSPPSQKDTVGCFSCHSWTACSSTLTLRCGERKQLQDTGSVLKPETAKYSSANLSCRAVMQSVSLLGWMGWAYRTAYRPSGFTACWSNVNVSNTPLRIHQTSHLHNNISFLQHHTSYWSEWSVQIQENNLFLDVFLKLRLTQRLH